VQDSPTEVLWSLADRLGSVNALVDGNGTVVDTRSYDSFGNLLTPASNVNFRYGYTGRELDSETGLHFYRARYYDTFIGRFISTDPIGFSAGDTNLYRYVGNSATLYTDANGTDIFSDARNILFNVANVWSGGTLGLITSNWHEGNFFYDRLVDTDKFVAGFADTVTFGRSTIIRENIYGDRITGQHEGVLFHFGQAAGFGAGFALGAATGVGWGAGLARAYTAVSTGVGIVDTSLKIATGQMDWSNPLSYLEVAGNFAPAIGFARAKIAGTKAFQKFASNTLAAGKGLLNKITGITDDIWDFASSKIFKKGQCFVAGTEIITIDGIKNIEDIQVGDLVLADDPTTPGEIEYKPVLNTFIRNATSLIDIYIDGEQIVATEEHPFWVPDVGWVAAKDLTAGMYLQTSTEARLDIDKVDRHIEATKVYNFEVEGFHTYFVSDLGFLVHNAGSNYGDDLGRLYTPADAHELLAGRDSVSLELFGGKTGQLKNSINIDIEATQGVKANILTDKLSFIPDNTVDEITTFNPFIPKEYGGTGISDYLEEAARVVKPGGKIIISGEFSNKFATLINKRNNITSANQELLAKLNLQVEALNIPLPDAYQDMKFFKYDQGGFANVIPNANIKTTILVKGN
jgi:RHS repeat-associated protein